MKHLTVRSIPLDLAEALEKERRRRGTSLNQTVIEVLRQGLALGKGRKRSNGLAKLAGTWSARDFARFERAIAFTEQIDEELWR